MSDKISIKGRVMWESSPFSDDKDVKGFLNLPKRVELRDTTLRDGEQTPGVVFRKNEKVKIAEKLAEIGVQRMEVAFPAVSEEDHEAAKEIAGLKLGPKIFCMSRPEKKDLDLAISAGVDGVGLEVPVSDIVLKYRFKKTREEMLKQAIDVISYAKEHGLIVGIDAFDSTRTPMDVLTRFINTLLGEVKADYVEIIDSYSVLNPISTAFFIRKFKERVKIPIEMHCHNELGMATANALAGVSQGADIVDVTVNGLGDKCGLPPIDEIALGTRFTLGLDTGIKYEKLHELSSLVEEISKYKVSRSKPIVGEYAHAYESGLFVWAITMTPYPFSARSYLPEFVGEKTEILLGKKSGNTSVKKKLEEMNVKIEDDESLRKITEEVKRLGILKKSFVTEEELLELAKPYVNTGE